jgi:acyl-CoA synthetase (AMP-forming)/AMP-acid ligase II
VVEMGRAPFVTSHAVEPTVEKYLGGAGHIALPEGLTMMTALRRNVAELGGNVCYRYLEYTGGHDGHAIEMTWTEFDVRMRAIAARLQQLCAPGDRVAILAPQGIDYVVSFFAAISAGNIAVPLFAPELPGHVDRLNAVLTDATPAVVLTTTAVAESVTTILRKLPHARRPRVIAVDAIPDSVGATYVPVALDTDDIAYLQYTSGSTRAPAGVEITHRGVCTNVLQMVMAGGLDTKTRSVSWLPLYHDMGLVMIMFPALCGGQITLMSPMAFVRRPHRWIAALAAESAHGRTFAAAPNFAFELAAQRGLPIEGETLDLSNVVGLLNGSEPVTMAAIERFNAAFGPYGLPPTAIKPSYGMAEATLSVASIATDEQATAITLDRELLAENMAVPVSATHPNAVEVVSCGRVLSNQWAVITDPEHGRELADGTVGEIWLHGDNIGHGYWGRADETELVFRNKLQVVLAARSHADGVGPDGLWLRTGDLGVYLNGELYVTGRIKDLVIIDGRNHYPQDIEATVSACSRAVRSGFVAAFSVPVDELPSGVAGSAGEQLVIVAERGTGAGRMDMVPVAEAIRSAISSHHGLATADVRLVSAGVIPRTTSGKLARRATRAAYITGSF